MGHQVAAVVLQSTQQRIDSGFGGVEITPGTACILDDVAAGTGNVAGRIGDVRRGTRSISGDDAVADSRFYGPDIMDDPAAYIACRVFRYGNMIKRCGAPFIEQPTTITVGCAIAAQSDVFHQQHTAGCVPHTSAFVSTITFDQCAGNGEVAGIVDGATMTR